jgi:hypothetical protein
LRQPAKGSSGQRLTNSAIPFCRPAIQLSNMKNNVDPKQIVEKVACLLSMNGK